MPIFGICLGHQLLGLAAGASTLKMKFGHHGGNHPVMDLDSRKVQITSQNHGFAVDEASLPSNVRVTHRSLFDGSNQGIELTDRPAFSFQGHPEASPGPHDIAGVFGRFTALMAAHPRVIATPHIGGLTPPAAEHQALETVSQLAALLRGEMPAGTVNAPQATRLADWLQRAKGPT